jgi:uncharacterized protein YjbI with pentapeptide repeats
MGHHTRPFFVPMRRCVNASTIQLEWLRVANPDHLKTLLTGVSFWNDWRDRNRDVKPDLSRAVLNGLDLTGADLMEAELTLSSLVGTVLVDANLLGANLTLSKLMGATLRSASMVYALVRNADLSGADLQGADCGEVNFFGAKLHKTNLSNAILLSANLTGADLSEATLRNTHLERCILNETNLSGATVSDCNVYGIAAWNVNVTDAKQSRLRIGPVEVDNLEVAQFVHLLLDNRKFRLFIDTVTSKVVLILGRFTPGRKAILDSIRDELRNWEYLPVVFDFEKPSNRDITETVSTLAHMARFVIADLSDPKSIPHELAHVVPLLPSVPIMPLIVRPQKEYAMFEHFFGFRHVLKPFRYRDQAHLVSMLHNKVIAPAEKLALRVAGNRG